MNTITGEHQARLLAVCFSLEMKLGLCGVTFQTRRDWDETWVRHSREEKQPLFIHGALMRSCSRINTRLTLREKTGCQQSTSSITRKDVNQKTSIICSVHVVAGVKILRFPFLSYTSICEIPAFLYT